MVHIQGVFRMLYFVGNKHHSPFSESLISWTVLSLTLDKHYSKYLIYWYSIFFWGFFCNTSRTPRIIFSSLLLSARLVSVAPIILPTNQPPLSPLGLVVAWAFQLLQLLFHFWFHFDSTFYFSFCIVTFI